MRSIIRTSISSIKPFDRVEQEHLDFVLRWIDSGVEICRLAKPATPETHLVAYFVLLSSDQKILLVDHKKAELWLPPGGHVEPGEHPRDAVIREMREELGVDADFLCDDPMFLTVTKTVGNTPGHTDVSLWYVLRGDSSIHIKYDTGEFHQIRWFAFDEIPFEHSDPHMKRFINKIVKSPLEVLC